MGEVTNEVSYTLPHSEERSDESIMKKIIGLTLLGFVLATRPAVALNRDALVAAARAGTGITNAYNINTVVINTLGSQINGAPIPSNSLTTLSYALAKIQALKNHLRNLH